MLTFTTVCCLLIFYHFMSHVYHVSISLSSNAASAVSINKYLFFMYNFLIYKLLSFHSVSIQDTCRNNVIHPLVVKYIIPL